MTPQNLHSFIRIVTIGLVLAGTLVFDGKAQGDVATDRPSESAAATLVPVGISRAELGAQMNWFTTPLDEPGFSYAVPIGIIRYGLQEGIELRVGAQFAQQLGELQSAMLGAKFQIPGKFWGQTDAAWLVELPINPRQGWATGQSLPMSHRLCIGHSLGDLSAVTGNAGWSISNGISTWMASMALSRPLGHQGWTGFIEPYLYSGNPVRFNAGAQLVLDNDLMVDFVYGRDFTSGDVMIGVGASFTLSSAKE